MSAAPRLDGSISLSRRSFLLGAAGAAASALIACTDQGRRAGTPTPAATPTATQGVDCADAADDALWRTAIERGIVYGSSAATWQLRDRAYRRLVEREAAILFTEDDLLWWRLRPSPTAELDFSYGDRIVRFAEREKMLVLGAHLVWDEGFGEGWSDEDLWGIPEERARELLFGTIRREVERYRGRVDAWIVANEVVDGSGLRVDVPWYLTIGSSYVADAFRIAGEADPDALLLLNDFGYESDSSLSLAADKQIATLDLLDELVAAGVPVHGLGIQAHLDAAEIESSFDPAAYRRFLSEVAARGMKILITELDVLDDDLPPDPAARDRAVADAIARYLEPTLDEAAVGAVLTFGLSDRYTWLEEDFPRADGAPRRPLPFDDDLRPKLAFDALATALATAPVRDPLWVPPRC